MIEDKIKWPTVTKKNKNLTASKVLNSQKKIGYSLKEKQHNSSFLQLSPKMFSNDLKWLDLQKKQEMWSLIKENKNSQQKQK